MTPPEDLVQLVRKFANNSYRFLFRHKDNVADLLRWREPAIAEAIVFEKLTVLPDTFVAADFAALESDVLLRVPFRWTGDRDGTIELFILIEHQSEPDSLMIFRVIRYVVLVYERQATEWLKTHHDLRGFEFDPVLPLVFYSGTRTWKELEQMPLLVRGGKLFEKRLPGLEPEFINLSTTDPEELQSRIGTLGWVLWLIQQKKRKAEVFRDVLTRVVRQVDGLHARARGRWEQLLWFAHALVYHAREGEERQQMANFIRETVRKSEQPEVEAMGKTIAEVIKEEGFVEGMERGALQKQRETLLRQLRLKFKRVSPAIAKVIDATQDSHQLDEWLDAVITAEKISDIAFKPGRIGSV
jgi:predicted transposase YdaD